MRRVLAWVLLTVLVGVAGCGSGADSARSTGVFAADRRVAAPALRGELLPAGTQGTADPGASASGATGPSPAAPASTPPSPAASASTQPGGAGVYDLGQHRGEVVVVNFWASWCAPCRDEVADLVAVHQETAAAGVSFLGINVRDDRDRAAAFLAAHPTGYPSIFDPAGETALTFKVPPNTIPATIVIDKVGRIAAVYRSAVVREDLAATVRAVAGEPT